MPRLQSTKAPAVSQNQHVPRYPTETAIQGRTEENDKEALRLAKLSLETIEKRRQISAATSQGPKDSILHDNDGGASQKIVDDRSSQAAPSEDSSSTADSDEMKQFRDQFFHPKPDVMLPLRSMYEDIGDWPKKHDPVTGALHYSWSNIGFPNDTKLALKDFEDNTHIEKQEPYVVELAQDIINIKTKSARNIADGGSVQTHIKHTRIIETFRLHDRTVAKIKFEDANVFKKGPTYSSLQTAKEFEKEISKDMAGPPSLEIEQWVTAQLLLCCAGQIGGKTDDYWRRARNLAQQQLHVNAELESKVREEMNNGCANDLAFSKILDVVTKCVSRKAFNPYYQARRNEFAVSKRIFHRIEDTDIIMVLDKADNVIAFVCSDAFRKLLTKGVEEDVAQSLETFSTLDPLPVPDMTRHGLHWIDWLVKRPELDFRNRENDPRIAKSGVYHFGARCSIGDPNGEEIGPTIDEVYRAGKWPLVLRQLTMLRYNAFGACTELVRFLFDLLDPELLTEYKKVAAEVSKMEYVHVDTRRDDEVFVMRAALVNVMTIEHKDKGDWHYGLAGLVTSTWVGSAHQRPRASTLHHQAYRKTVCRCVDSCMGADLEDIVPEYQVIEDEIDRFPERHMEDSDEFGPEEESENSMKEAPQKLISSRRKSESSEDADVDESG
ncbi:hypothetical protein BJ170DRAFT_721909 [Xylariales sp. AK1849]|nr:hypothetical protein BJ170DRAFT_721909 [Xylariales sp. AK1849]